MIFTQKCAKLISALRGIEFVENTFFIFFTFELHIYKRRGIFSNVLSCSIFQIHINLLPSVMDIIACSWVIAASSLSHSSKITEHSTTFCTGLISFGDSHEVFVYLLKRRICNYIAFHLFIHLFIHTRGIKIISNVIRS